MLCALIAQVARGVTGEEASFPAPAAPVSFDVRFSDAEEAQARMQLLLDTWAIKNREFEDLRAFAAVFSQRKYKPGIAACGAKYRLLLEGIVPEAVRRREKVLVFSQSIPALDLLELYLSTNKVGEQSGCLVLQTCGAR